MIYILLILAIVAILWPNFLKRSLKFAAIGAACIVVLVVAIAATVPSTSKTSADAATTVPAKPARGEGAREAEALDYAISEANKIPVPAQHFDQGTYDGFLKIDADAKKFSACVASQIKLHGWLAHAAQREMSARYKKYGATCFDMGESVEGIGQGKISAEVLAFDMADCHFDVDHPMLDETGNFDQRDTSGDPKRWLGLSEQFFRFDKWSACRG